MIIRLLFVFSLVGAFVTTTLVPFEMAVAQESSSSDEAEKKKKEGEGEEEPDC